MAFPRAQSPTVVAGLLTALVLLAWWALWIGESAGFGHHALHSGPAIFIAGWALMTVAMMLPTTAPLVLMFHRMVDGRAMPIALLVTGYLAVWTVFGALVYFASRLMSGLIEGNMAGAAILFGAGLYQFTPLKYACLDKCRSPLGFLMSRWRGNAFALGAAHGMFCVGCCWSLMLVMFAVSAGSLAWMLVLGAIMAAEKNLSWGRKLSAPVGVALIAGATAVAFLG
jgi:predicted metal-binding membrane protein